MSDDEIDRDIPQCWHYCPLCGDAFIPDGSKCRRVLAKEARGNFLPVFDEKTGDRIERKEKDNILPDV